MMRADERLAVYRQARRDGRIEDARLALIQAQSLCRSPDGDRSLVDVLKGFAQLARDAGRPADAIAPYEEAVAICRHLGQPLLLAHTVRHLGDAHMESGRAELADPCFVEALALYRGVPERDELDFANALRSAALHREAVADTNGAVDLWREAREGYARADVEAGVAECDRRRQLLLRR